MQTVMKTVLNNGLTVFLKEIHTAPLVSHWVWYRVGSRNEKPGFTGISHWVEHMQFKGTAAFPTGVLDKAVSRDGGMWNAFTYLDWTAYFETLPADKVSLALELEADRMVNSLFESREVESERTVIISERQGNENEPLFRLDEAVQEAAFSSHPYRHEVIGLMEDLQRISRDDLYAHYRSHYNPANAVLAIAGDFKTPEMLKRVEAVYGSIPAASPPEASVPAEPRIAGEKQVEVSGPGETTYLMVAYRAPRASADDFFTLTALDSLLSGPASLNMFGGGGVSNKTSRLYRALVEKELAVGVGGGMQATIDPFLYAINITVRPDQKVETVLAALDEELARVRSEPVAEEEIARAIKQARAQFAYGSENVTNQAFWMGYSEMFDSYAWFEEYVDRVEKASPGRIRQAAVDWLDPGSRVVGVYRPEAGGGA